MNLTTEEICFEGPASASPISLDEALSTPGVYRLKACKGASAALVVRQNRSPYYVNSNDCVPFEKGTHSASNKCWKTNLGVPDEIVGFKW